MRRTTPGQALLNIKTVVGWQWRGDSAVPATLLPNVLSIHCLVDASVLVEAASTTAQLHQGSTQSLRYEQEEYSSNNSNCSYSSAHFFKLLSESTQNFLHCLL